MDFADRATILPSDEPLSQTDELFCLWRGLCPMTKSNAEWRVGVRPVLLIANTLWTPPMGYVEWRLSIVMFKQLSTLGHWTTQKGAIRYQTRSRSRSWCRSRPAARSRSRSQSRSRNSAITTPQPRLNVWNFTFYDPSSVSIWMLSSCCVCWQNGSDWIFHHTHKCIVILIVHIYAIWKCIYVSVYHNLEACKL